MSRPELWARRRWLQAALAGAVLQAPGVRLALAAPTRAGSNREDRLVVVMLRGALDGLAAVPPVGDPGFAALRPQAEADHARFGAPLMLDRTFALHSRLSTLHGWFKDGQLLVAHAVASPYRERSHFDAQQLIESGGTRPFELQTGWLGRALQATGGQGVALGAALPLALRGADGASSWAPSGDAPPDPDWLERVGRLYAGDARLGAAFAHARDQREGAMASVMGEGGAAGNGFVALAGQAGRLLAASDGPSIAWLDANGWDTHTQQAARLNRQLESLDQGLAALRVALGERWARTSVLVMTEFGRSAAMNGSGGTDHGTGGVAFRGWWSRGRRARDHRLAGLVDVPSSISHVICGRRWTCAP